MVAEWINEELLKTKANLEAKMQAQIAAQQAKAQNDYIIPKNKALEEERNSQLLKEKQAYDEAVAQLQTKYNEKVKLLNDTCELQKANYRDQIYTAIVTELSKEYASTIQLLDSQINH